MADETMLDKPTIDKTSRVPLHVQPAKHFDLRLKMMSLVALMVAALTVGGLSSRASELGRIKRRLCHQLWSIIPA
jgi:hypothetical protein